MHQMRNFLVRGLIVTVALAWSAATAQSQSNPPNVNPTHYWTYQLVNPLFRPDELLARDQFLQTEVPLHTDYLERLVNWVRKNNSAVPDTFIHYTWWNIREKLPTPRVVRVTNQFGSYVVNVANLEFMLVPAWKNQPQPVPPYANHYLCYRAFGFPGPPTAYSLRDEWRDDIQQPHPMEYLCNPCMKIHQGQVFLPPDPATHLALYPITPTSDFFYPLIFDQFAAGPQFVQQRPIEYLLVPSDKKDEPTPTRGNTWGKLKTLYR